MKVEIKSGILSLVFLVLLSIPMAYSYNLSDGLVGFWDFDSRNGTIVYDSSGNGHYGNITNAYTIGTGYIGNGYASQVDTGYVNLGNSTDYQILIDLSILGWVYVNESFTYSFFLSKGYEGEFEFYYAPLGIDGEKFRLVRNNYTEWCGSTAITDFGWYHFAISLNTSETNGMRVYVNGTEVCSALSHNATAITTTNLILGNRADDGADDSIYANNNTYDEVKLYNRALSSEEVSAIFNLTTHEEMNCTNITIDNVYIIEGTTNLTCFANLTSDYSIDNYNHDFIWYLNNTQNETGAGTGYYYEGQATPYVIQGLEIDYVTKEYGDWICSVRLNSSACGLTNYVNSSTFSVTPTTTTTTTVPTTTTSTTTVTTVPTTTTTAPTGEAISQPYVDAVVYLGVILFIASIFLMYWRGKRGFI